MIYKISGFILFVSGLSIILDPKQYSWLYKYTFDFTEARWIFGIILILFGILIFAFSLKKKAQNFEPNYVICPSCLNPYFQDDIQNEKCPKCNIELEELEGFYDRHPELRNQNKGENKES